MPTSGELKEILELSVEAPSGDNSQPWEFKVDGGCLKIFNLPDRDETLYNFRQQGSYFAHGALIENIAITASHFGYQISVETFPGDKDCTAKIFFKKAEIAPDPLRESIKKRATNRKPYIRKGIEPDHFKKITAVFEGDARGRLYLTENREKINKLAKAISLNERLLMECRPIHDFLFSIIRWKAEEAAQPGLYIMTMEFPPPVRLLFKYAFPHWRVVQFLNIFGLSRLIPKQSGSGYASSAGIGAIVINDVTPNSFLEAGRTGQRLWLTATGLGLSFQPITALPYLYRRINAIENEFSKKHRDAITIANKEISNIFGLTGSDHVAMIFRIGYDGEPSARSLRLPPVFRQ